jgi:hypothetical protein
MGVMAMGASVVAVTIMVMSRAGVFLLSGDLQGTMVMKVKESNHQKHGHNASHHPPRHGIGTAVPMQCVRKQMEDCNSQHQPTHKTDDGLHVRVRQPHYGWQQSTANGRHHDQRTIRGGQKPNVTTRDGFTWLNRKQFFPDLGRAPGSE